MNKHSTALHEGMGCKKAEGAGFFGAEGLRGAVLIGDEGYAGATALTFI